MDPNFVPDPLSSDPLQTPNGAFDSLNDPPNCTSHVTFMPCRGLLSYTMTNQLVGPANFMARIHQDRSMAAALPMPPSPSPKLTDRQLEIMDRWFMNPLP
jgi:hypothetical protein